MTDFYIFKNKEKIVKHKYVSMKYFMKYEFNPLNELINESIFQI